MFQDLNRFTPSGKCVIFGKQQSSVNPYTKCNIAIKRFVWDIAYIILLKTKEITDSIEKCPKRKNINLKIVISCAYWLYSLALNCSLISRSQHIVPCQMFTWY